MSENKTELEKADTVPVTQQALKMSDDLISMVRELVQFSLLTGTNIVDHFRAVQMELMPSKPGYITLTANYVKAWNTMVLELNEQAAKQQAEMQKTEATED